MSIQYPTVQSIQERLVEIGSDALGVPIRASDDFFALGGDSISATHLMLQASESFGVDLQLPLIYSHTTIELLSLEIDRLRKR